MGVITKLKKDRLDDNGNFDSNVDIYPITHTKAVYDENNASLSSILNSINESIDNIKNDIINIKGGSGNGAALIEDFSEDYFGFKNEDSGWHIFEELDRTPFKRVVFTREKMLFGFSVPFGAGTYYMHSVGKHRCWTSDGEYQLYTTILYTVNTEGAYYSWLIRWLNEDNGEGPSGILKGTLINCVEYSEGRPMSLSLDEEEDSYTKEVKERESILNNYIKFKNNKILE